MTAGLSFPRAGLRGGFETGARLSQWQEAPGRTDAAIRNPAEDSDLGGGLDSRITITCQF